MVSTANNLSTRNLAPNFEVTKTTKIVVGVDSAKCYVPAVDLVGRLNFRKPALTLLHAVNPCCPLENADARVQAEYAKVVENIGLRALDSSIDETCRFEVKAKTKLAFGRAADVLILEANMTDADLIAIRALKHGSWTSGYMGSATCALTTNCSTSLLIAKKPIEHHHSLRAVLAIDHSAHTAEILFKFLQLGAEGISDVLVLTSYEVDDETAAAAHKNLPMLGADVERWLTETLSEKNNGIVNLLQEHGFKASSKVVQGSAEDNIRVGMQEFRADLLILGALGTGSSKGGRIGSIALHEITAEPYSILLLR